MPDEPDPPRKFYGFKPREFDRANEVPSQSPPEPPTPDPGIVPVSTERIDIQDLHRIAARGHASAPSNSADPPAQPAPDPGVVPFTTERIDVRELNRIALGLGDQPLLSKTPAPVVANEVHAMLRQNHAIADAAGLNRVAPVVRRKRRRRDFIVLMIGGNAFIFGAYAFEIVLGCQVQCLASNQPFALYRLLTFFFSNPIIYVLPAMCMGFYSAAVWWLLHQVLEDY